MIFRRFLRYIFCFIIPGITALSCEKFKGDQTIPAYLRIDSIYLTTDYATQGTASHHITDAWVYVDDELIGAFELPAKFPVLKTGKHKVKVWPGIKKNGIAATRISYDYYSPIQADMTLTPDSTAVPANTTVKGRLKTTYQSYTLFIWKEDFENVSQTLDTTKRSTANIQDTPVGSALTFEGNHSGMVVLDSLHNAFECQTHSEYPIPDSPVYLEMNFNTSFFLTVGVVTYGTTILYQTPVITLVPTNGAWKKIYIDLTSTLNAYSGMSTYRVYLGTTNFQERTKDTIRFDNFKIVNR